MSHDLSFGGLIACDWHAPVFRANTSLVSQGARDGKQITVSMWQKLILMCKIDEDVLF